MSIFKNLITETGSFGFNGITHEFNGEFETKDKDLIAHLSVRNDWVEISKTKIKDESNDDNSNEDIDLNDIDLESQNKKSLVDLAESLEIQTEGLSKKQLIEAIEIAKTKDEL